MTTLKEEQPYAAVVNTSKISLTCSKCFAWNFDDPKRGKLSPCPGCQKICYCSEKCKEEDLEDHEAECERFKSSGFVPSENARLVMRMMEKSRRQPEFKSIGGHTYFTLDDNYATLRENAHCMAEAGSVYSEIKRFMGPNAPNLDAVFRAYSKMTINSFEISDGSWDHTPRGIGLYLDLSFLKHSCRPDAFVVNEGSKMMLRTTMEDCKYSDKLTISYIEGEFFLDTKVRRDDLQKYFSIDCKCEECKDVESNKKRTSGRPDCCPHSWFSVCERPVCNDCGKDVCNLLKDEAEAAMNGVKGAISVLTAIENISSELAKTAEDAMEDDETAMSVLTTIENVESAVSAMRSIRRDPTQFASRMTTLKEEEPYAVAVSKKLISLTCSKCFAWNFDDLKRVKLSGCSRCKKLSYCSEKCEEEDLEDHKAECKLLESANFIPSKDARLVMRMMEKSKRQPEFKSSLNGRTYGGLDDNYEKLRGNGDRMAEAARIYSEIYRLMGSDAPELEAVFRAYSKMATHAFAIYDGSWNHTSRGIGLYLDLPILKHSCRPDAFVVNQGSKMILRTVKKDCVYSDELTISYSDGEFFLDTEIRRADLQRNFSFFCECEECGDVESNKKRTSGRPRCCRNSWFSLSDPVPLCNNCGKHVPDRLAKKAKDAMTRVKDAISDSAAIVKVKNAVFAMVPEWIDLLNSCEKVLSDENRRLFHILRIISRIVLPLITAKAACDYADGYIPLARKSPHSVCRTILLASRHQFYEWAEKPLQETSEALDEAVVAAQVVFSPQHELTQTLLEKKVIYDLTKSLLQETMIFEVMNLFINYDF